MLSIPKMISKSVNVKTVTAPFKEKRDVFEIESPIFI